MGKTKNYTNAFTAILELDYIPQRDANTALELKMISANVKTYRKYNLPLTELLHSSIQQWDTIDLDLPSLSQLIKENDKYHTTDDSKKRQAFIFSLLPEIKQLCETVGVIITFQHYARNRDIKAYPADGTRGNGKGYTPYSFVASQFYSFIQFRIESNSTEFCLEKNLFSMTVL